MQNYGQNSKMEDLSLNGKAVWTNGCFDILHVGHIELFKYAKSLGKSLVVGIDTDARVRRLKGWSRPVNRLEDRATMLKSISYVDRVVTFDSDEELRGLIKTFSPSHMVIGSDHKEKEVIGSEYADNLVFFDRIEGYASSNYIN